MTLNPEALANPLYNPDYIGLIKEIYKYFLPPKKEDIMDLKLAIQDYTRVNKYENVIYNPRLGQIEYAESLVKHHRASLDELDKILHKYYFETDFSCNLNVTAPCGCPDGMTLNQDRTCTGPIQDPPLRFYAFNSAVPVSITSSAWHAVLKTIAIWASNDGRTPYQITDTFISFITRFTVPISGNYQLEAGADTLGHFFLNGVLTISSTDATVWTSQTVALQAGQIIIEARVQNNSLSQSAESWTTNPGGVGFRIIAPDGSVVITSRDSSVKAVPFLCCDSTHVDCTYNTISNLDKRTCSHYGTIQCTVPNPVTNPILDDWNYWVHLKAGLRLPFQSEVDQVNDVLEKFKDWTNMLTANFTYLLGTAQHDIGMREKFQGIDNPCDCMKNYLGSLKEEGQDLMTQIINILLGFAHYISQIKEMVTLATNGRDPSNPSDPQCVTIDFPISTGWLIVSGILMYNGQQAIESDLTNGTLYFTDGSTWDPVKYLAANPTVQERLNQHLPLFPTAPQINPIKLPTHSKATNVGLGYGVWVSTDGLAPVYEQAMDKWVSLVWTINIAASGTYSIHINSKDKSNLYIDDFNTILISNTSTIMTIATTDFTAGVHNIYAEGWHNTPPTLSDPINDPAYIQIIIYSPDGQMFWNTRTNAPLPCLCATGYTPNPNTFKCTRGGSWDAADHLIQIGAEASMQSPPTICLVPPCPFLIGLGTPTPTPTPIRGLVQIERTETLPRTLTPIFQQMQSANGDKLLSTLKAITDRIDMEMSNLIKAMINMDKLSIANDVNKLPDDPCAKKFVGQVIMPAVAALLKSRNNERDNVVTNPPLSSLIPLNAAPAWNDYKG